MAHSVKHFWGKRPGFDIGDIMHIAVNLGFALVVYAMAYHWDLTLLAVVLVVLSKWRVLAVQPRYWMPNIRTNLVDLIVGLSTVGLLYHAQYTWLAVVWSGLYGVWLLAIKPRDQEVWVGVQAFWAQLTGLLVLFMTDWLISSPFLLCLAAWLVAWSCARHLLSSYEESQHRLLSLAWSFFVLQLAWIGLHWVQYYTVFGVKLSLTALVIGIVSLSLGSVYHAYKNDQLTKSVLVENLLFGGVIITIVLATARWTSGL